MRLKNCKIFPVSILMKTLGVTIGESDDSKTYEIVSTTNGNDIADKRTRFLKDIGCT